MIDSCCRLVDRIGTETVFITVCVFIRIFEGLGASAINTASYAIIAYKFPDKLASMFVSISFQPTSSSIDSKCVCVCVCVCVTDIWDLLHALLLRHNNTWMAFFEPVVGTGGSESITQ